MNVSALFGKFFVIVVFLSSPSNAYANTQAIDWRSVKVPRYQSIEIEESQASQEFSDGLFSELEIKLPYRNAYSDDPYLPGDFDEFVSIMTQILPGDYYNYMLYKHGFISSDISFFQAELYSDVYHNRFLDVATLIFEHMKLGDSNSKLVNEFNCMGGGKFIFAPVFYSLVALEESKAQDSGLKPDASRAVYLVDVLRHRCKLGSIEK